MSSRLLLRHRDKYYRHRRRNTAAILLHGRRQITRGDTVSREGGGIQGGGEKSAGARRTNLSVRWSRNTVFPYKCQGHKFKKKKGWGKKWEKERTATAVGASRAQGAPGRELGRERESVHDTPGTRNTWLHEYAARVFLFLFKYGLKMKNGRLKTKLREYLFT